MLHIAESSSSSSSSKSASQLFAHAPLSNRKGGLNFDLEHLSNAHTSVLAYAYMYTLGVGVRWALPQKDIAHASSKGCLFSLDMWAE